VSTADLGPDDAKHLETLSRQYEVAVDLYKHEDLLTWQKVNHLLYMNGGMVAIFAFLLERDIENIVVLDEYQALQYTSWIGLLVSFAFSVAIWLGTHYMMARKLAVIDAEQKLAEVQGSRFVAIVTPREMQPPSMPSRSPVIRQWREWWRGWKERWLAKSWTVYVLRALPLGFLTFWLIVKMTLLAEQRQDYQWDPGLFYSVQQPLVGHVADDLRDSPASEASREPVKDGSRPR
jgi:hypothetical protein